MTERDQKLESAFARIAAEFLSHEANSDPLITVTRCEVRDRGKFANIFVSVLPAEKSKHAMDYLRRKRSELREYATTHIRTHTIPTFEFLLDPDTYKIDAQ
jgi:ribosome-binding factor A